MHSRTGEEKLRRTRAERREQHRLDGVASYQLPFNEDEGQSWTNTADPEQQIKDLEALSQEDKPQTPAGKEADHTADSANPPEPSSLDLASPAPSATATAVPADKSSPGASSMSRISPSSPTSLETRFGFDEYSPLLYCMKHDCRQLTNCWDGRTVVCPGCGPYCYTRYCCRQHLYDDLWVHWNFCGLNPVRGSIDEDTVMERQVGYGMFCRPADPTPFDSIERYRQAVYHSMEKEEGDFFIFHDIETFSPAAVDDNQEINNGIRGQGRLVETVNIGHESAFVPANTGVAVLPKAYFRVLLEICLRQPHTRKAEVLILFHMIREVLMQSNRWTLDNMAHLCQQFRFEFDWTTPPELQAPFADVDQAVTRGGGEGSSGEKGKGVEGNGQKITRK